MGPAPGPLPRIGPCQRGRRGMGPAATHKEVPTITPLKGLLGISNLERKPRAKVTWPGPEKGIGKMGKQAEAGSGACGELDCASQGGPGAGVGGCQPCGGLGWTFLWSPSQNGFGVPPTKDLVWTAEGRGTLRPGASRAHPWLLLGPSPRMARCGSTGQLPTWSPKPGGQMGRKEDSEKEAISRQ